jgi:hypothetical protein
MAISGRLTVTFHEGKDLVDKDIGKQDPFCTAAIVGEKLKTKTHNKGGKNPVWEQALLFNLKGVDYKEVLHIQCWDEDTLSNDKIGRADVPLKYLFEQAWEKKDGAWFQIVDFDNFKKICGYLRLSIKWDGDHPSKFGFNIAVPAPAPAPAAPAPAPASGLAAPQVQRPVTVQQPIIVQPPIVVQSAQPPQVMYQPSYAPQPQPVYAQQPAVYMQPQVMPVMYQQPVYQQPMYQQPMYQQPVYQQPVYQQPVYQQPPPGQPMYPPAPGQPYYRQF